MSSRFIFIGAASKLAKEVYQKMDNKDDIFLISRHKNIVGVPSESQAMVTDYNPISVQNAVSKLPVKDKTVIIFFNGTSDQQPFFSIDAANMESLWRINFHTPLLLTQMFLKKELSKDVRFIFLSSSRAEYGDKGIVLYSATKAALKAAVKSLALEYAKIQKYFYIISLGFFDCGLINEISDTKVKILMDRSCIADFVEVDELIRCLELASHNKSLTGSVLYCDNGYRG